MLPEVRRIVALPRLEGQRAGPSPARLAGIRRTQADILRPVQLAALGEVERCGGLLGIIGVGQGKFLISTLAPSMVDCQRPLLLVPPALLQQTLAELERWRAFFHFHPALTVLPYSVLSSERGSAVLESLAPDFIVADECSKLRRRESGRTRRLVRWVQEHPATRCVMLSGTMTARSVVDFDHLAELALREGSPVPRDWLEVEAWAACMDARTEAPPTSHQMAAVAPLVAAFPTPEGTAPAALYARLRSCPGVLCTVDTSAAECSLRVEAQRYTPAPALKTALADLRKLWQLPDGTELLRAVDFAAAVRQLQVGFYYRPVWGPAGPNARWLEARLKWGQVVRQVLALNIPGADTPGTVAEYVRNVGPRWRAVALETWEAVADRDGPGQEAVWVSDAHLQHIRSTALRLEADRGPVLVWCEHVATLEGLAALGMKVCRPGDALPATPCTVALSRPSFGMGTNLQAWSTNLVLEPLGNGEAWEQLLGRTHREGQADEDVLVLVPYWDRAAVAAVDAARADAEYVQQATGQRQKLLLASWWDGA